MKRRYFSYSGSQLEDVIRKNPEDVPTLHALLEELGHRNSPKMQALREEMQQKLALVDVDGSSSTNMDGQTQNSNRSKSRSYSPDPPGAAGLKAGERGRIRACGGLKDVPPKRHFAEKTDVHLDIPEHAPLIIKYEVALRALIREMRRKGAGAKRVVVEEGKAVTLDGRENGYRFQIEGDEQLFEGAALTATIGGKRVNGQIVSIAGNEIIITLSEDFGPFIRVATLQVDNTAMLEALTDRLHKVANGEAILNTDLAMEVISNTGVELPPAPVPADIVRKHELNKDQARAVGMAQSNTVSYLWGPPGTGKTISLAALHELLFEAEKRILICSNTNQAVDQVLLKLCKGFKTTHPALQDGKIVRIGQVHNQELADQYREYVTLNGIVERKSITLRSEKQQLEEQINRLRTPTEAVRNIVENFRKLDSLVAELEKHRHDHETVRGTLDRAQKEAAEWQVKIADYSRERDRWQQAGTLHRVILRSESAIISDLDRAIKGHHSALENVEAHSIEQTQMATRLANVQMRVEQLRGSISQYDRKACERALDEADERLAELNARVIQLNKQLDDLAQAVVQNARIVGATVTKAYLSPQHFANFDVVVIDEASMVMLPALFYAAGLAKEKVVISGDFRQLAPIVLTDQKEIRETIGNDVFYSAGIRKEQSLKRTVQLKTQYRMVDPICRLISRRMYDGRLETGKISEGGYRKIPTLPFDGPLTIVDTSPLLPFVNRDLFGSRFNLMNALVVRNLCRHLRETGFVEGHGSLGVCTPYAAQAKITKRVLEGHGLGQFIEVGTVHRYQGDQKTAMVLDIPDSLGEWTVGVFLEADLPDDGGARLFNVAVSRTERHLIVVCNLAYLDRRLPDQAFLREILHNIQSHGRIVDARDVLAFWPIEDDLRRLGRPFQLTAEALQQGLFRDHDFQTVCTADMEAAKRSIAIFSGFFTPQRVAAYSNLFQRKIGEGVKIRCVSRPPKNNANMSEDDGREILDALEALGCIVDTRWEIHEKVVIIDDEIVWFGSLNPLSHTGRTDEMMARLEGREAALQLAAFMSLNRSAKVDQAAGLSVTKENPVCPDCRRRVTLRKGRHGPYWECEGQCGWRESLDKPKGRTEGRANPLSNDEVDPDFGTSGLIGAKAASS